MNEKKQKSPLSVCIIARNEEKFITDCILSVKEIASEIILVDTGSSDKTVEIAESHCCRVFHMQWQDDFSLARNQAIEKASYPFILSIDADERLINPEVMAATLVNAADSDGGWLINVESQARRNDGNFDVYNSKLLRLFRNHPEIRFSGVIHEQVVDSIIKLGLKIADSELHFIHLGYSHDSSSMRTKQERNLRLLNKAIDSNPNDPYLLHQRSRTYLALGEIQKAELETVRTLEIAKPGGLVRPQALNFGAVAAYQLGDFDLSIKRAVESLELVPEQSFANFILGEALSAKKMFADAYEAYKRMKHAQSAASPIARMVGDYSLPPEQLSFRLGRSLVGIGMLAEAQREFLAGLNINPNEIGCLVGLANVDFRQGNIESAKTYIEKANAIEPGRKDLLGFLEQIKQALEKKSQFTTEENSTNKNSRLYYSSSPLLTLSMIVKNEELMLSGCLESVAVIVDEIIVVDTGSTDNTKEIALKHGAKIFDFEWKNDFAAARNEALSHSNGRWILYLDADERLLVEDAAMFRSMLENLSEDIGGLVCTIESSHIQLDGAVEHHRGGYPRLFRNYGFPQIAFQGRVHEQITPSIFALGKSIILSDVRIEHLGYNQSREIMDKKVRRNYHMLIEHVKEEPLNAYAWYQLGQTLAQMSLFEEAENAIRFALQIGKLSDSVFASAAATLSQLVGNRRQFEEALLWAERSLEKAPSQVYALNLKAFSLLYLDRKNEAEAAFIEVIERLKRKKTVPQSGFDIDIPESVPLQGLEKARSRNDTC